MPGDVFNIDYLPKRYRGKVYFQIMKITNTIDTTGWKTSLETVMRVLSNVKGNHYYEPKNMTLSRKYLQKGLKLKNVDKYFKYIKELLQFLLMMVLLVTHQ